MFKRMFECDANGTPRLIYESLRVGIQPANVSGSVAAGNPSGTVTSAAASCAGAGSNGVYTYSWVCSGCTATSPNSASTTFYATVDAGATDNASAYCEISDGVTSVNTNTISVTLTNTSPSQAKFTFTAASDPSSTPNIGYGYAAGFGTLDSVSGLPAGITVSLIEDVKTTVVAFALSGFSSDPTQSSLASLVCNGVTLEISGVTAYSYNSGTAEWQWGATLGLVAGTQYAATATPSGGAW